MRCAGSRTYPKLAKKWSAESEANGLGCEAAREISQPTSTTQYIIVLNFFAFQTIISGFDKRFVEMHIFGKEISDVVVWKMYVCNAGFVLPALKKSWNRIQSRNRCF